MEKVQIRPSLKEYKGIQLVHTPLLLPPLQAELCHITLHLVKIGQRGGYKRLLWLSCQGSNSITSLYV